MEENDLNPLSQSWMDNSDLDEDIWPFAVADSHDVANSHLRKMR